MSVMQKGVCEDWCLKMLDMVDVSKTNFLMRWVYTWYYNRVVLPKFQTGEDLTIRQFQSYYAKIQLFDKKNSTRYVYLILFYVRTPTMSYVFWNLAPTAWPFDTEHDWTFRFRKQSHEIISIITEVVRYARESTDNEFFNRLKYIHRKSKRLAAFPMRLFRACNQFF